MKFKQLTLLFILFVTSLTVFVTTSSQATDNGDGFNNALSVSAAIPNPGFGLFQTNSNPGPDQTITRIQTTFAWKFHQNLMLKCEWFRDNYGSSNVVDDFYVQGLILALNARF